MADTETIETTSTPAETVADTSETVEPVETTDTSTQEPETENAAEETTETETKKLYADKYETVENLEKGYKELQGSYSKAKEFEAKYNELLKNQELAKERKEQERLEKAQKRGFNSYEEAKISDEITLAEYGYYANNLNNVAPESFETVRELLNSYYSTGQKAYLEEAKRYYSSDFIENVAIAKTNLRSKLENEFSQKRNQEKQAQEQRLGEEIKANFGEFLEDIQENEGKATALKMFCNAGFIQSLADMSEFEKVYNSIAKVAGEQAIKEYEAKKAIEATKNKAVIPTDSQNQIVTESDMPTAQEINENPAIYRQAVKKWGMDKIDNIIMKG